MTNRSQLRAADTDRQQVADRLAAAAAEGRLDLDEYEQRLRQAFAATSYADLDRLTADLPNPVQPQPPVAAAPATAVAAWIAGLPVGCLVAVAVLLVAILT